MLQISLLHDPSELLLLPEQCTVAKKIKKKLFQLKSNYLYITLLFKIYSHKGKKKDDIFYLPFVFTLVVELINIFFHVSNTV